MKSYLLILLVCSYGTVLFGQKFTIDWGEMDKSKGRLIYLLPGENDDFHALRWSGGRLLGHYQVSRHEDLKLTASNSIRLVADNSMATFEGARMIGDKFAVFLSDKKDGQNHFYMQVFDEQLNEEGDIVHLASYDLEKGISKSWFEIKKSQNGKFFGVVWEIPGKGDDRDRYGFKTFSTDLNLMNDGEYPLPFDSKYAEIHSHHISNSGDYFLALTEYKDSDDKKLFKNNVNFKALHIYHIAKDGLQDFELDVQDKSVHAMAMTSDSKNIFTVTGIYGEPDENGVKGVFYQKIDLNSGVKLADGFKEFGKEFIYDGWTDKLKEKAERREERGKWDPQLYNYHMKEAVIQSDGSIIGTLEQYYVRVVSTLDSRTGQSNYTYYYYYNNIIAYKIGVNGEFDWLEKIRKYQVSTNDGGPFSSYSSFVSDNKLYFIFNDNINNYDEDGKFLNEDRLQVANYSKKKNVVALVELDLTSGEQIRSPFFDRTAIKALAMPKLFDVNYNKSELLIYTIYGRNEKFGRLKF